MKRYRYKQSLLVLVLLSFVTAVAQAAPKNPKAGQCNTKASLITLQNLAFGDIVAAGAGDVTVATDGLRSSIGGVVLLGGVVSQALFEMTSLAGCDVYGHSILLPASTALTSATSSMTVDSFVSTISGPTLVDPSGVGVVSVGATLHVGLNQPSGAYSGQYVVEIIFQ